MRPFFVKGVHGSTFTSMAAPVAPRQKRSAAVADSLRERLERGEWAPSEKLPSEHELAAEYGVSR
ncbi:MAG: GntR family transcriptional regulator, partial [Ilumatobacteraceae bacterium]